MTEDILTVRELSFRYAKQGRRVLEDISFSVKRNETVGIIGVNGAGKSTLLKLFMGLLAPFEGEVTINGLRLEKKNLPEIRKNTGYLFQNSDNQLFLPSVRADVAFGPRNYGLSEEAVRERTDWALGLVQMTEFAEDSVYHLSGGQKKRAAIAAILSMKPELLLLDEPSVSLDPRGRRQLIEVLSSLPGTKIITSHDLDLIRRLTSRVILMASGRLVRFGNTGEVLGDTALLEANGL